MKALGQPRNKPERPAAKAEAQQKARKIKQKIKPSINGVALTSNGVMEPLPTIDIKSAKAAALYSREEARSLVDFYWSAIKQKTRVSNKESAFNKKRDLPPGMEPLDIELGCTADGWDMHRVKNEPIFLAELKVQLAKVISNCSKALKAYAENQPLGQLALQFKGIGHVSVAACLSHIDLHRCCCPDYNYLRGKDREKIPPHECDGLTTAGHIYSFAGMNDKLKYKWEKRKRRPWNTALKTALIVMGKCIQKIPTKKKDKEGNIIADIDISGPEYFYFRLLQRQKAFYQQKNDSGGFKQRAAEWVMAAKAGKWDLSEGQKEAWFNGKLQQGGVDMMAIKYTCKFFLSHYHEVGRKLLGMRIVAPYSIGVLGHADYVPPPLFSMK